MKDGKELLDMANRMFSEKQNWNNLCQEIGYFFAPQKADFTDEITLGEEFASYITDPTPIIMARDLGDSFGTMLRSDEWFKVSISDEKLRERNDIARFLDYMTEVTRAMLYDKRAGFTRMAKEHEHDFAYFGGGVSTINLNRNFDGFSYRNWHQRDTAYTVNEDGDVDRLARKINTTCRKVMAQFGNAPNATVPQSVKDKYDQHPDDKVKMFHLAVPRDMHETKTRQLPRDAPFLSIYISEEGDIVQELAEYEFPYVVSRWRTVSGWGAYPFSPATMAALPMSRGLQTMMQTFIEAGEKQVDPPLVATTEAISSPVDITAGGITWVDAEYDERLGQPLVPLELGKNVQLGEHMLMTFHRLMAESMYISKLNIPQASGEGTAFEMSQLVQQNIRQLQPIFEPAQDEIVYRYLDRVVSVGLRLGAYGPPDRIPPELFGEDITFTFFNPLQAARDRRKATQFQEASGVAAAAGQLDPSLLLELNPIRWVRDAMMGIGAPADWLQPEEAAMQARMKAQAEQQKQAQIEQLGQAADVAARGGEAAVNIGQAMAAGQ